MLDEYIKGNHEAAFLKKMAMMATQAGDKPGAILAGNAYIAGLKQPLSEEDIQSVSQFTKSTKDPGFALMQGNPEQFKKVLGDRKYTTTLMNMIFYGEMEPLINAGPNPDWKLIEENVKPFGEPGKRSY